MDIQKTVLKALMLSAVVVWVAVFTLPDNKLHVVKCGIGKGEAVLVWKGTAQMLIDGGQEGKVILCLARYIPFYDRRIEVVLTARPQRGYLGGRYGVENFMKEGDEVDLGGVRFEGGFERRLRGDAN